MNVADDLDGARSDGALAGVVLRITLDGYRDGSDRLRVELDGKPLACEANGQQPGVWRLRGESARLGPDSSATRRG